MQSVCQVIVVLVVACLANVCCAAADQEDRAASLAILEQAGATFYRSPDRTRITGVAFGDDGANGFRAVGADYADALPGYSDESGSETIDLNLRLGKLTDQHLQSLRDIDELEWIILANAPNPVWQSVRVTDEGMTAIRRLNNLRSLVLCNTWVTERGLLILSDMKNLRLLYLNGQPISQQGLTRLRRALPRCEIVVHDQP